MSTRTFEITRGGVQIEVECEFSIRFGSTDSYSPMHGATGGDPDEVEITGVYNESGEKIELTDEESGKFETEILENASDYFDPYDGDDY